MNQASCVYLPRLAIHTATGEASRVYSINLNIMTDGCFLRGCSAYCSIQLKSCTVCMKCPKQRKFSNDMECHVASLRQTSLCSVLVTSTTMNSRNVGLRALLALFSRTRAEVDAITHEFEIYEVVLQFRNTTNVPST